MHNRFGMREIASVALLVVMTVCLAFALAGEGIDLAWLNKPIGNIAGTVADGFAWAFTAALVAEFVLIASAQEKAPHGQRSLARH